MFSGDVQIAPQVTLLRGFAAPTDALIATIDEVARAAPFRHLQVPGGGRMSVAMTNTGPWGWHSDTTGYRYLAADPATGHAWPPMPAAFLRLARTAAKRCGFCDFTPDACLINRYAVEARMGTHRDYDEHDMQFPIVSVSIGLPAVFLWYGSERRGTPVKVPLEDGDVVVWGGMARAGYHGVRKIEAGRHSLTGALRYNLTFRRAAAG